MPIRNIIDERKRRHRWLKINAVIEATWHDNRCRDADQETAARHIGPEYEEREHITLTDAVAWANAYAEPVTLYLYDKDSGIYPVPAQGIEARKGEDPSSGLHPKDESPVGKADAP